MFPNEITVKHISWDLWKTLINKPDNYNNTHQTTNSFRDSINEIAVLTYMFLSGTRPADYITNILAGRDNMFGLTIKRLMGSYGRSVKITPQSQEALDKGIINIPENKDIYVFLANLSIINYMTSDNKLVHEVRP